MDAAELRRRMDAYRRARLAVPYHEREGARPGLPACSREHHADALALARARLPLAWAALEEALAPLAPGRCVAGWPLVYARLADGTLAVLEDVPVERLADDIYDVMARAVVAPAA